MFLSLFQPSGRAPLDFNTPHHTDSVADALVSEPALPEGPCIPAPESLLSELGLPPHRVREALAESRSSTFWE